MGPYELLKIVVDVLEKAKIPYLVTGSVGAMAYGEPRMTNDIDIVAAIEERHIAIFLTAFPAIEFYIDGEMIREAVQKQGQFNIIHPSSGLKVDLIIKKDTPFDNSRFGRLKRLSPAESYQANFAAAEDIIIKKMEYYLQGGSEKHLRDITGMIKISREAINFAYITSWAKKLGIWEIWEAIQKRIKV